MSEYKGMSFPFIFDNDTLSTKVVEGKDKVLSNIQLIVSTQLRKTFMSPDFGINLEALVFAEEPAIVRDFVFSFVNDAIVKTMTDVELYDVKVTQDESIIYLALYFLYKRGNNEFIVNAQIGGELL